MARKKNENKNIPATQSLTKDLAQGLFDMKKNLEGLEARLPQISILHGDAQMFKMPDESKLEDFEAVILDFNRCNAYWSTPFSESGGGTPPDCASLDSIDLDPMSEDPQSKTGKCRPCDKNQFGSDESKGKEVGRGKACKNMMRVHLLFSDQLIPFRLTIPATSLESMDSYIPMVASKGLPYQLVRTKFSLKTKQNKDGIKFSGLVLQMGETVQTIEEGQAIKAFVDEWKPLMRSQPIDPEEHTE